MAMMTALASKMDDNRDVMDYDLGLWTLSAAVRAQGKARQPA